MTHDTVHIRTEIQDNWRNVSIAEIRSYIDANIRSQLDIPWSLRSERVVNIAS